MDYPLSNLICKRLLVRGLDFPSLLYLDSQSTTKGMFLCVVGDKGSNREVILTSENLRKVMISYASWCFMCKSSDEHADYLLLHFQVANRLWQVVINLFGVR